jgi:hypothetical protein
MTGFRPSGECFECRKWGGRFCCRRLVGSMGGELSLEGEPGAGTRAAVLMPMNPRQAAGAAGADPAPVHASGGVLVCDDDPVSSLLLAEMLRQTGYGVEEPAGAPRTVVVICSGNPAPVSDAAAPMHDAFISKPVDMATLIDTLRSLRVLPGP